VEAEETQRRAELATFGLPVEQDGKRHNDKMGSWELPYILQICDERNGLKSLPKTHLVCQYTVDTMIVTVYEPIQLQ
jgi:hypothetical protein